VCNGARHSVEDELDDESVDADDDHPDGWPLTGGNQAVGRIGQLLVPAELG